MTSPAKLYAKLLANPGAIISFRDFERLLRAAGFELRRIKGSHRQYRHPRIRSVLSVQPLGSDAKPYQVQQFLVMMREAELSIEP